MQRESAFFILQTKRLLEWIKEVDSCSLRCVIFNLEDAYQNFFSKRGNYPTFKNKFSRQTYRTNCIRSSYKRKDEAILDI